MEIICQAQPGLPPLSWAKAQAAAHTLLVDAGRPRAEVSVLLVDDPRIHALNRQWRDKDKPTDVLSWPQHDVGDTSGQADVLGDVVISLDTATRQARARKWPVEDEVALLLVHGILHLLGHEDDTLEGSNAMQAIETRILGKPLDMTLL